MVIGFGDFLVVCFIAIADSVKNNIFTTGELNLVGILLFQAALDIGVSIELCSAIKVYFIVPNRGNRLDSLLRIEDCSKGKFCAVIKGNPLPSFINISFCNRNLISVRIDFINGVPKTLLDIRIHLCAGIRIRIRIKKRISNNRLQNLMNLKRIKIKRIT